MGHDFLCLCQIKSFYKSEVAPRLCWHPRFQDVHGSINSSDFLSWGATYLETSGSPQELREQRPTCLHHDERDSSYLILWGKSSWPSSRRGPLCVSWFTRRIYTQACPLHWISFCPRCPHSLLEVPSSIRVSTPSLRRLLAQFPFSFLDASHW